MADRTGPDPTRAGDEAERQRRDRLEEILLKTTPAQRLAWLEEAIAFAAEAGALPRPSDPPS